MFIKLNDTVSPVASIVTQGETVTIAIQGQTDVNALIAKIGTEIRIYEDELCTVLVGIYQAAKIIRVVYEPQREMISVTVQANKLDDMTEQQLRESIAALQDELAAAKILLGLTESETEPEEEDGEPV